MEPLPIIPLIVLSNTYPPCFPQENATAYAGAEDFPPSYMRRIRRLPMEPSRTLVVREVSGRSPSFVTFVESNAKALLTAVPSIKNATRKE
jgi:hypothetical protein